MADPTDITAHILANEIALVGELVRDVSAEGKFYAFVKVTRGQAGEQNPTNFKLRSISNVYSDAGVELAFILVENDEQDILANAKAMVMRQYPELVRNVFPTFGLKGVVIWIEPKRALSVHEFNAIELKTRDFLAFIKAPFEALHVTSDENLPTATVILKAIRLLAPVSQEVLVGHLVKRKFHVPHNDWLAHTLDKLRKANFILRSKAGFYSVSLSGLKSLGSGKGRNSPDVARALAIARRGP